MKIFIPSYGRAGSISTPSILDGFEWNVVVHDQSEYHSYKKTLNKQRIIMSGCELGLSKQRNWIIDNLVNEDEWFVFMDDNIKEFLRVHPKLYETEVLPTHSFNHAYWTRRFTIPCNTETLNMILEETRNKAEQVGAKLAGFATTDNPYFRNNKWRYNGYVIGKTMLIQKNSLRFDERFFAKEDMDFSAQNLDHFGIVVVNNYMYRKAAHYAPGGIGNRNSRKVYKQRETQLLIEKWPDMISPLKRRSATGDLPEEVVLRLR